MTLQSLVSYGKAFQLKVINALLTDRAFLLNVRSVLEGAYFDSDTHKWIIQQVVKYYDDFHTTLTVDVLKVELQKVENELLRVAIKEELKNALSAVQDDIDYVKEEFTQFCRNQKMKAAILASADLLKVGDFDGIRTMVEQAIKAGLDQYIGHEYNKDVESRYRLDYRPTIATPWPIFNELIQGGLGPGDLAIIFGNPGGGKSWLSVAIAAHALKLGYNVNYYTLELGETYVGKRFDACLTGIKMAEIDKHRDKVEAVLGKLKGKLIVKEYAPKTATVNTIKAHVQKTVDLEHKPDLIVIDYVDYLKPSGKGFRTERKDEIDDVFIATKALAKELNIPILTPSQVNRSGAKDDIIEGDKAAGSYDKMMVADICFSLSRKKEDKVLGTGRIHVMKNRYGHDGMTYEAEIDTDNGQIKLLGALDEGGKPQNQFSDIAKKFFSQEPAPF
jgi:KaiC/GvpD/RAD55 family RecA-like ATPase